MIFTGCGDDGGGSDPEPTPTPVPSDIDINMVSITGGTVSSAPEGCTDAEGDDSEKGIFQTAASGKEWKASNFKIAESETPYSVWYAVRVWAENYGYTFANKGREGSGGTDGAAPADGGEPVTSISWRDAVVWCNAYSEAKNLTPAYYNADKSAVLKSAIATYTEKDVVYYVVDSATVKDDATGFRLPTEVQWEYAARGGSTGEAAWNYIYAGTNDSSLLSTFAVYKTSKTANVESKQHNSANLYDMSGNVYEWCFDWYGNVPKTSETDYMGAVSGSSRVVRGGSWSLNANNCEVALRDRHIPSSRSRSSGVGFRVALPAD